jgi:uncharacterized protein YhaN
MKIKRLLLQAFGPFTNHVIDFAAADGNSNVHVIYGQNEAGKSSALRAMMDLRFGIEAKSNDNFIHDYKAMRVGADFETASGETLSLMRRKGNKNQLGLIAADGSTTFDEQRISREHVLALSDGLSRHDFALMFGINHQRLREGGMLLLKGEGELGAALFEASTGMRGVQSILSKLDDAAKAYYAPRAKNAIIPVAKKQWEDEKKRLNESLLRPKDWQQCYDAQQQAKQALKQIDRTLEQQRRHKNKLTQWRSIAPLLQDYDAAVRCLQPLLDAPDLADDAAAQRLHAEQAHHHAQTTAEQATLEQTQCREALAALHIEPLLLQHRATIKRLAAKIDLVMQSRSDMVQARQHIEQQQQDLTAAARRISPAHDVAEVLASLLSQADAKELGQALDGLATARADAQRLEQAMAAQQAVAEQQTLNITLPTANMRQHVLAALQQAQALGDNSKRIKQLQQASAKSMAQFQQALYELGMTDEA